MSMIFSLIVVIIVLQVALIYADDYIITTIAGTGSMGSSGDGSDATSAQFSRPYGVAVDTTGNIFIADSRENKVRKVDTNGIITTIAGTGSAGSSGDGGDATNASLNYPMCTSVDSIGNVYIADFSNKIRKIDVYGIVSTIAGTGERGNSGDGGAATSALLSLPHGVSVDGIGNVYIADTINQKVRKVDVNGIITTIAGTGSIGSSGDSGAATAAELHDLSGVAIDSLGIVYIADSGNNKIRRVDTNGIITTIAGTGNTGYSGDGSAATNASLNRPTGVALDVTGNVYIADFLNSKIRKIDTAGIISTIAGTDTAGDSGDTGPATSASLHYSWGIAVDTLGNVYISDTYNHKVKKLTHLSSTPIDIPTVAPTQPTAVSTDAPTRATRSKRPTPVPTLVPSKGRKPSRGKKPTRVPLSKPSVAPTRAHRPKQGKKQTQEHVTSILETSTVSQWIFFNRQ